MSDSPNPNPYSSPSEEGGGKLRSAAYHPAIRLFVWPFFLAHLVYWPAFFIWLQMTGSRNYGTDAMLYGMITLAIAGLAYGTFLGLRRHAAAPSGINLPNNQPQLPPATTFGRFVTPLLYALGQGVWFVFCVFAPCAVFFVGLA